MVWYGILVWYGMLVWCDVSIIGYCRVWYGMVWYASIIGYDMVYYKCMHDLEVQTHVHDVKVSGMAMMLWC